MLNRIMSETIVASLRNCLSRMEISCHKSNIEPDFEKNLESAIGFCELLSDELGGLIDDYDRIKQELYELKKPPHVTEK